MASDITGVWAFSDLLHNDDENRTKSTPARVTKVDNTGTVWVALPGGTDETPINGLSTSEVKPGDTVQVEIENGRANIVGNASTPSVGQLQVNETVAPVKQVAERAASQVGQATEAAENAETAAKAAKAVADATSQHFWSADDGAHVTEVTQDEWNDETGEKYHSGANSLWNSLGMLFRNGLNNLLSLVTGGSPGVAIYDGEGNEAENIVAQFTSAGARIGKESSSHLDLQQNGIIAYNMDSAPFFRIDLDAGQTESPFRIQTTDKAYMPNRGYIGRLGERVITIPDLVTGAVGIGAYMPLQPEHTWFQLDLPGVTTYTNSTISGAFTGVTGYVKDGGFYIGIEPRAFDSENDYSLTSFLSLTTPSGVVALQMVYEYTTATRTLKCTFTLTEPMPVDDARLVAAFDVRGTVATAAPAFVLGQTASTPGIYSAVIGEGAAEGDYAVALGSGTTAASASQVALGSYNEEDAISEHLLIIGNGAEGAPHNALTVGWDGHLTIPETEVFNTDSAIIVKGKNFSTTDEAASANSYDGIIEAQDADGEPRVYMRYVDLTNGVQGGQLEARRMVNGAGVNHGLQLRIAADGTRTVAFSDVAAWLKGLGIYVKYLAHTALPASTPSSDSFANALEVYDANNVLVGYINDVFQTNGRRGVGLYATRQVSGSAVNHAVRLAIDASGNRSVYVHEKKPWLDALGTLQIASGQTDQSTTVNANSYRVQTISFGKTFNSTPNVTATLLSSSTAAGIGGISCAIESVTTTNFKVRIFNSTSSNRAPGVSWIAVGY